jgi:hypothetical protein
MYRPQHIALATFLGTPLAGFLLLAANYANIGRRFAAVCCVALGIYVVIVLAAVARLLIIERGAPSLGFAGWLLCVSCSICFALVMEYFASLLYPRLQPKELACIEMMRATWTAICVGVGTSSCIVAVTVVAVLFVPSL